MSPIEAERPWAFLSFSATAHGGPRWLLLDGEEARPVIELTDISDRLRRYLRHDPRGRPFDDSADRWLEQCLGAATRAEREMLPRRLRRALDQMDSTTERWARLAEPNSGVEAERWRALRRLALPSADERAPDGYLVAQRWLDLVGPLLEAERRSSRRPYVLLRHIEHRLSDAPLDLDAVEESMSDVTLAAPIDERITACILGVGPGD